VGRLAWQLGFIFHRNPIAAIGDVLGGASGSSVGQKAQSLQRINIALYGYGGDGHSGAYLTDSIMVLSIQPQASGPPQVAEISIPRDWYVPIDLGNGHRYQGRINEAYSDGQTDAYPNRADQYKGDFGGGRLADATLEKLLGIHIDHFVGIDFHAFQYAVDAVGGVDVVVPHTFTDTQYPHGECDTGDCGYMTVHFDAGPQHMDGRTALIFARSRHSLDNGEGTDFARSRRQQIILQALKQKVVSVNGIAKLPDVLGALGGHVVTDMGIGDAKALYDLVKNVDTTGIDRISIDNTNFLYDCGYPSSCGAYYLYTRDTTYRTIAHFMEDVFPPTLATTSRTPVTVLDASGTNAGASARWTGVLGAVHLDAADGGRAAYSATTHVILTGGGAGPAQTAQYLSTLFGVPVDESTPSAAPTTGTAAAAAPGVTLVLGADEECSFNHETPGYYYDTGGGSTSSRTSTTTHSTTTTHTTTTETSTTTTTSSTTDSTTTLTTTTIPLPTKSSTSSSSSSTSTRTR
jgi:polyisoprenyl-teichoic acid--peptidoglycan teichoic acid transferase